jgi:hypothetical protein
MGTPGTPPSSILQLAQDVALDQSGDYEFDSDDRAYIDSQNRGMQQLMLQSVLLGMHCTWLTLDHGSATAQPGHVVCSAGTSGMTQTLAVSAALASAGGPTGVVITGAAPGGQILVALKGAIPASISGLAGSEGPVCRVNLSTAFLQEVSSLSTGDYPMGTVDAVGNVALATSASGSFTSGGGGGGGGQFTTTVVNGANSNVPTNSLASLLLGGPTAAFSVGGFALPGGATPSAGQQLVVVNTTTQPMSIINADASSTSKYRIDTQCGVNVTLPVGRKGTATFTYNGTTSLWVLQNIGLQQTIYINVRDFGAAGDGVTDDSVAIQNALNALMAAPNGGTLYFPPGTYVIKRTLTLVGDYYHNYNLIGDVFGEFPTSLITWAGPAKATMLNCWGLNNSYLRRLGFNGGGQGIYAYAQITPIIGASCCVWFHTNQYNTISSPPGTVSTGAASNFNFVEECSFIGVVGGLYPLIGIGDGAQTPGCVSVDGGGTFTIYEVSGSTPPTTGDNSTGITAFPYAATTFTSNESNGSTTFPLTSATSFTKNMGIVVAMPGETPWFGIISNISGNTITAADNNGVGLALSGGSVTSAAGAAYTCYPNAVGLALPSGTTVAMNSGIASAEVQGIFFQRCWFIGGGYDTTPLNPQQHTYACVAIYSGGNTEQFGFRDCAFDGQFVYGFYWPNDPNNQIFFENVEWTEFTGAPMSFGRQVAGTQECTVYQCYTECQTGFGYFVYANGGAVDIDGGEINTPCMGNPYTAGLYLACRAKLNHFTMECGYGVGASAQPMSIDAGGDSNVNIEVTQCQIVNEASQLSIYTGTAGNDLFASSYGSTGNPATNKTHAWDAGDLFQTFTLSYVSGTGTPSNNVYLHGNWGNNASGAICALPDLDYKPKQIWAIGPKQNGISQTESFRSQQRAVGSGYDVDYTHFNASGSGGPVYLYINQPYLYPKRIVITVTQAFSATTTLNLGSSADSPTTYQGLLVAKSLPAVGKSIHMPAVGVATADNATISNAFLDAVFVPGGIYVAIEGNFAGTLTSGHLKVYVETEMMQS